MKRLIICIISLFALTGCSQEEHQLINSLRINFPSEPQTFDPRKGTDISTSCAHFLLFEGLTRNSESSTSDYGMAERIDVSPDRKTYTFHLRDAYWTDGHPVTSHDFAFAWSSMLEPSFPCPNVNLLYPIKNAEQVKAGILPPSELGIREVSPKILEIALEAPTPYFLELIAFCVCAPVPSHIAEYNPQWADAPSDRLVTNGPYEISSWISRHELNVMKSHSYWNHENVLHDGVCVSFVENQNTAMKMFDRGDLDIVGTAYTDIPNDFVSDLKDRNVLKTFPVAASTLCAYNLGTKEFSNEKIRKALSMAINRKSIVENIVQKGEEAGLSAIPAVLRGTARTFIEDNEIEKARALFHEGLAELGLTKEQFQPTLIYTSFEPHSNVSQALQDQWRRVLGINVTLQQHEVKVFLDKLQRRDYEFALTVYYAQYNDQMNILERFRLASNPKNYPGWENKTYQSLLLSALHAPSEPKRMELMEAAERVLLNEMPFSPIYHWSTAYVAQPYIENISLSPLGAIHLPTVKINIEKKRSHAH